jgi:hypothetical protein
MNRVPEVWQVFGPGALVAVTLGVLALFTSLTASVAELRRDIVRMQEERFEVATAAELRAAVGDPAEWVAADVVPADDALPPAAPAGEVPYPATAPAFAVALR